MQNDASFIKSIKNAIQNNLPGEESHVSMTPYKRGKSSDARKNASFVKLSAIAIHLFKEKSTNDWQIILIKRTSNMSSHKNQIAFPGGKVDKTDADYVFTAKRESFEELGIDVNKGELLGQLTPVYIPVSNFDIYPFVFYHKNTPQIMPNKMEVENYYKLKIKELFKPETIDTFTYKNENGIQIKNVPCFKIKQLTIWGATALIINEFKELILNLNVKNQKEEQH